MIAGGRLRHLWLPHAIDAHQRPRHLHGQQHRGSTTCTATHRPAGRRGSAGASASQGCGPRSST
ncbi:MAG: hypothetical protein MZV64_13750 [Ignavibacteriales bacterium]|nr:hypothetical protein [Ignavibacteriales bacterium]